MSDLLDKAWKTLEGFPMSALSEDAMEAIVSLVIEEAAKVAEEKSKRYPYEGFHEEDAWMYGCEASADAIRSLLNKGE